MAVDKLVDSAKLNAALDYEASKIIAKGGGTAPLAFDFANEKGFGDYIDAIPSGGDPYDIARKLVMNTLTSYEDSLTTKTAQGAFSNRSGLTSVKIHNCTELGTDSFGNSANIAALAFPKLTSFNSYALRNCKATVVDFGPTFHANIQGYFMQGSSFTTLIFRYNGIVPLVNIAQSMPPAFLSNGAGGTIYIPKSMYDHLGDGGASDYKAATNWVTLNGYGKTTWAKIEGSIYETQYADGTPIS